MRNPSSNDKITIDQNACSLFETTNQIINTNIEKNVLELIKTYGFENNCVISSFNPFTIRRVKNNDPKIVYKIE